LYSGALTAGAQEVRLDRIASVSQEIREGGKRWKLPLILCSTVGTLALYAAVGTEVRADALVPAAAAITAAIGTGGYFAGKAMEEHWELFVLRNS
jgi:hypothetical protein